MAVAAVGTPNYKENFSGSSETISTPTGLTTGDYMLCMIQLNGSSGVATATGWEQISTIIWTGEFALTLLGKEYTGTTSYSFSFSETTSRGEATMAAWSGVDTTEAINAKTAAKNSSAEDKLVVSSISPSVGKTMLVFAALAKEVAYNLGTPSGMTYVGAAHSFLFTEETRSISGATGSRETSASSNVAIAGFMVALNSTEEEPPPPSGNGLTMLI